MADNPMKGNGPQSGEGWTAIGSILKSMLASAKALGREEGIDSLIRRCDEVAGLDAKIETQTKEIEDLKQEAKNRREAHTALAKESLQTYTASLDDLRAQVKESNRRAESLADEVERESQAVQALKSEHSALQSSAEKLIENLRRQEESMKRSKESNQALQQKWKASQDINEQSTKTMQLQEAQNNKLSAEFDKLRLQNDKLGRQHKAAIDRLARAEALTIKLSEVQPESLTTGLEQVWLVVAKLVCSFFSRDMPHNVLQDETVWRSLNAPSRWQHHLPIPQSNSDAAKQMRSTVVLANIMRCIDAYIFQPTALLPPTSGIRDLLIRQTKTNSQQEAAFRAIVQALAPTEQDTASTCRVDQCCSEIIDNHKAMLSGNDVRDFEAQLRDIVEELCDSWQGIRSHKQAIKPSFELENYGDWPWHELRLEDQKPLIHEPAIQRGKVQADPAFVVFPRLYVHDEDGQDPLTHGVVVLQSSTTAAREELETLLSTNVSQKGLSLLTRRSKASRNGRAPRTNQEDNVPSTFLAHQS